MNDLRQLTSRLTGDYRIPAAALAGAVFAVALIPVWNLQARWFVVVIAGITMVSLSLIVVRWLDDFLMAASLVLMPLASFQKWLFLDRYLDDDIRQVAPISGAISLGITEFVLIGAYAIWFVKIFIARTLPLPSLHKLDFFILLFVLANVLSVPNATDPLLSIFAIVHLLRHFLVYFYFSRRLQGRHLQWMLAAFALAIVAESALGVFQYKTGMLKGLILDKGQGGEDLNYQYEVPGIENVNRATGTSYDSHSYGLFLTMLLPFPFAILMSNREFAPRTKLVCVALLALGSVAVFVSFSRSAWLTLPVVLGFVWFIFVMWREKQIARKTGFLAAMSLIPLPKVADYIARRFAYEGGQNLTARYDQFPVALAMWKDHLWTGQGVGNYMVNLRDYQLPNTLDLPVHNVLLWIGADIGIFGVVTFYAMIAAAMWQLIPVIRARRGPTDLMAVAAFAALIGYNVDGLTNPLFRESLVYMTFWLMMALSVALPRIQREVDAQLTPASRVA